MKLKNQYLKQIAKDTELQGLIAKRTGKSVQTISRWVENKDEKLTMLSVINAIREYLNLDKAEVLTEETKIAA